MSFLNDLTTWVNSMNQIMAGKSLPLPLAQSILILMITTGSIIFGRIKLGLLIAHGFIFFWVFIANRLVFMDLFGGFGMLFYLSVVLIMSIVTVFGLFQETN